MRRILLMAVLLVLTLWICRHTLADVVGKDRVLPVDVAMSEGFELESWSIGWTVVDADGSGASWTRLGENQFYDANNGVYSMGCRFNEDGSANDDWLISPPLRADTTRNTFRVWYRSQDPLWPETVEFLALHLPAARPQSELSTLLGDFELLARESSAPVEWQEFLHVVDPAEGGVWYFAVRCVSQDRFVLLVDDASGLWTVPQADWVLESQYERMDFGLMPQSSVRTRRFRLWNMHEESLLDVLVLHRPRPPFVISETWVNDAQFEVDTEDSLSAATGVFPIYVHAPGDTSWFTGSFSDSLVLQLSHSAAGDTTLTIPYTVSIWSPDTLEQLLLYQDFEAETLATGWELGVAVDAENADGIDPLSWEFGSHVSSANFTIPTSSRFAYVNSDARGLALEQDAWLMTPWLDVSHVPDGQLARGLLLGWDQVYNNLAGGRLEILADSGGTGWHVVERPRPSAVWVPRDVDLSRLAGSDSLRLAFRFTGNWSYGVALDNIVLLAVTDALPGYEAPGPPREQEQDEVVLAPNPFNPVTQVRYLAANPGQLDLRVYNLLGQQVLAHGPLPLRQGMNSYPLDFSRMASGTYLVRLIVTDGDGSSRQLLRKVSFVK